MALHNGCQKTKGWAKPPMGDEGHPGGCPRTRRRAMRTWLRNARRAAPKREGVAGKPLAICSAACSADTHSANSPQAPTRRKAHARYVLQLCSTSRHSSMPPLHWQDTTVPAELALRVSVRADWATASALKEVCMRCRPAKQAILERRVQIGSTCARSRR